MTFSASINIKPAADSTSPEKVLIRRICANIEQAVCPGSHLFSFSPFLGFHKSLNIALSGCELIRDPSVIAEYDANQSLFKERILQNFTTSLWWLRAVMPLKAPLCRRPRLGFFLSAGTLLESKAPDLCRILRLLLDILDTSPSSAGELQT